MANKRCQKCRYMTSKYVETNVLNRITGQNEVGRMDACSFFGFGIPSFDDYPCRYFVPKEDDDD